jgi:MFS family permease
VPALNALLNFAQRIGMKYILYQSLEVQVTSAVLHRLQDHHTKDTLVVGPVFDGHAFVPGETPLNGRTTPWNTLALWSVRKLALTGFLCIADGLPEPPSFGRQVSVPGFRGDPGDIMGSDDWWVAGGNTSGFTRQQTEDPRIGVPAGVEEVTAIALLQHLYGVDRARAILLELPPHLEDQLSWSANWGQDERRKKWHKYKMASKVSRPAAQVEQLFKFQRKNPDPFSPVMSVGKSVGRSLRRRLSSKDVFSQDNGQAGDTRIPSVAEDEPEGSEDGDQGVQQAGTVMHFRDSISPPTRVRGICFASYGLFYANSTDVLAFVFRHLNEVAAASPQAETAGVRGVSDSAFPMPTVVFAALLIGGVYLPMPLSLWLTRAVTRRFHHIAGLVLFASALLVGQVCIVISELVGGQPWVLLLARLVQGLGSGALFQVRFLLASMTTSDLHQELQSFSFLVSDLGLGMGALLPAAISMLAGSGTSELSPTSVVLALTTLLYLVWVLLAFPSRPHFLPDRVRFGDQAASKPSTRPKISAALTGGGNGRLSIISGTTRVFVQSAIMPVVALSMRDAHWTGSFRQTIAVAAVCLLPMPFEAFASRICCTCQTRSSDRRSGSELSKMASGAVGLVGLAIASAKPRDLKGEDGELMTLWTRLCELAILMIALAMAAPFNASRLSQLRDAERSMVMLEWMKAYVGRIGGPLFAVLVYSWAGYGPLLAGLVIATAVVTLTA